MRSEVAHGDNRVHENGSYNATHRADRSGGGARVDGGNLKEIRGPIV